MEVSILSSRSFQTNAVTTVCMCFDDILRQDFEFRFGDAFSVVIAGDTPILACVSQHEIVTAVSCHCTMTFHIHVFLQRPVASLY